MVLLHAETQLLLITTTFYLLTPINNTELQNKTTQRKLRELHVISFKSMQQNIINLPSLLVQFLRSYRLYSNPH